MLRVVNVLAVLLRRLLLTDVSCDTSSRVHTRNLLFIWHGFAFNKNPPLGQGEVTGGWGGDGENCSETDAQYRSLLVQNIHIRRK